MIGPMLPPGGRNWQLMQPDCSMTQFQQKFSYLLLIAISVNGDKMYWMIACVNATLSL
jgi:hypothetical protein